MIIGVQESRSSPARPFPNSCTCCFWSPNRSMTCKHTDSNIFYLEWLPSENISMGMFVIVCTASLSEFLTWENLHFGVGTNESWSLCLYCYLPDVRKALCICVYTLFLLHCPYTSVAMSGSRGAECVQWGCSWKPVQLEQVTVNHTYMSHQA